MFNPVKALHSKVFAQNFLKDAGIARALIRRAGITQEDTIVEIGPGEGVITHELAQVAGRVLAIESDPKFAEKLRRKFDGVENISIICADFLQFDLGHVSFPRRRESTTSNADRGNLDSRLRGNDKEGHGSNKRKNESNQTESMFASRSYKVFSNIPFNITNQIVKKLLYLKNPPRDAYLFTQTEAADRLCGIPKEQEFSILTKPWFSYEIMHNFKRTDFIPIPSVDVVLLHICMRRSALLNPADTEAYRKFVRFGYRQQKKDLMAGLKNIFTYEQWRRIARDLKFFPHARTVEISAQQWVGLFRVFQERVDPAKKKLIG